MIMMRPQFDEATLRQMLQELMELQKVIHRELQSLTARLAEVHAAGTPHAAAAHAPVSASSHQPTPPTLRCHHGSV